MTRATFSGWVFALLLVLLALVGYGVLRYDVDPAVAFTRALHRALDRDAERATAIAPDGAPAAAGIHEGLLHGRITTLDGSIYEGRLRWGGDEEALWGNYFNGVKDENPWATYVPRERLPKERLSIGAFGFEVVGWDTPIDVGRPLMVRFGDIARIEPRGRRIRVILKSGAMVDLDRFSSDDLADGIRVWDETGGSVEIGEWQIRDIELFSVARPGATSYPLHGTVRTRQGDFTGLIQWEREQCLGSDELHGRTADGEVRLRFDTIRSIARRSPDTSLVTTLDGREIVLSGPRDVGLGNRGTYVDDPRYGRVLISWNAFQRLDFSAGGTGPAYEDFPPGRPLSGNVTTRSGRRLSGTLVYDLDESETTETLDAPWQGVDYTIPLGLVASIVLPDPEEPGSRYASVTLHSGERLGLELRGDLGAWNLGMLVFSDDGPGPEYVPWADIEQIDFDRPPEMYPPDGSR